jgi:hypothetical protein
MRARFFNEVGIFKEIFEMSVLRAKARFFSKLKLGTLS